MFCRCGSKWQCDFAHNCKQVVNTKQAQDPAGSLHISFTDEVKLPQGEGSAVIHHKKNYLLYKDAACLCHSLAQLWVVVLEVLLVLALGLVPSSVWNVLF